MSDIFWKHFHLCFSSTLKCLPSTTPPSKHDHQNNNIKSTSTSSLVNTTNFNSLYDIASDFSSSSSSSFSDSSDSVVSPPDFTALFASQRFFFSSPGRSNSIVDSSSSVSTSKGSSSIGDGRSGSSCTKSLLKEITPLNGGGVAVQKYSPDPHNDFRCSMQEMIEARNLVTEDHDHVMADWEFLHQLLRCYLTLNPAHTHKFIISAFADILMSLLSPPSEDSVNNVPRRNLEGHRR